MIIELDCTCCVITSHLVNKAEPTSFKRQEQVQFLCTSMVLQL